jgi:thioredoxin-dependent peroxiredoxin
MKPNKIRNFLITILVLSAPEIVTAGNPDDFRLNSVTGNSQFILSHAKGKFVALHFLLKTECPHCLRHTQEYFEKAETLPNVVQVFIKPDTEKEIEAWSKNLPAEDLAAFPIFRDPEAKLADQFNIPGGYAFHNQIVHYPALILIGPEGKEVFRYIGKDNSDRFSFGQLAAKVREFTQ